MLKCSPAVLREKKNRKKGVKYKNKAFLLLNNNFLFTTQSVFCFNQFRVDRQLLCKGLQDPRVLKCNEQLSYN